MFASKLSSAFMNTTFVDDRYSVQTQHSVGLYPISLTGTLSHLSTLATKTTHALLAPLGTHTTLDTNLELDGVCLDKASYKGTRDKSLFTKHNALLVGWDKLNVLNRVLEVVQGSILRESDREGLLQRADKNLHDETGLLFATTRNGALFYC
jgi:hypothetical protein